MTDEVELGGFDKVVAPCTGFEASLAVLATCRDRSDFEVVTAGVMAAAFLLDLPRRVVTVFFAGDLVITGVVGGWLNIRPPGSSSTKS